MLFNSYLFIFLFLPITLTGFYLIGGRGHHRIAISWLVFASLFFYGWWNPIYLGLILVSILFNYTIGIALGNSGPNEGKRMLAWGVAANIGLIGYYKYANFFVDNINKLSGQNYHLETILLPLAISFFTFQQIAYLVDAYKGQARESNFLRYCLFITFFPQLIAGPIVHHKEMLPQFAKDIVYKLNIENIAVGVTIFSLGLFKKVIFADNMALHATPIFSAAEHGAILTIFEAWRGVLAYTLQLYFDFSGYSDMAIGLARMFGIRLPMNFNSPYKAVNIIGFWRRWHITLSRFLRDYLYIPLGGNRRGKFRRYINVMLTMLLGGLWHGASWTFVMWGGLHGLYLIINYAWHAFRRYMNHDLAKSTELGQWIGRIVTFIAVVIGWVFFRAETIGGALSILNSMITIDTSQYNEGLYKEFAYFIIDSSQIFLLLLICWYAPNVKQILYRYQPTIEPIYSKSNDAIEKSFISFSFTPGWAFIVSLILACSIIYISRTGEFLYFNF